MCGEYISMESWDFLDHLGLHLQSMNISHINRLQVSAPNGKIIEQDLSPGGFGISRYVLDSTLANIARSYGVTIEEQTKVNEISFDGHGFMITTSRKNYKADVACGSYGKRSNIDIKWKRRFITKRKSKLNNYVAVKYHVRLPFPDDMIALHNFRNGYCGIVKIEGDKYCLCYLTNAENLQQAGGSIATMEKNVLMRNPHLEKIWNEMEIIYKTPLTISRISFARKKQVDRHVLMVGDAAGMITPLCGNGMSMALHGSKLAAEQMDLFLQKKITRQEMEDRYIENWQHQFDQRLKTGRRIQRLFGHSWLTNSFISIARQSPGLVNFLVKQTHGIPF